MKKHSGRYIGIGAGLVFSALTTLTSCENKSLTSPPIEQKPQETAESNEHGFSPREANTLKIYRIDPEVAVDYATLFRKADDVIALVQAGIRPEVATEYGSRFSGRSIVVLHRAGIPASEAGLYALLNFDEDNIYGLRGLQIERIYKAGCDPIQARSYKRFRKASDIVDLAENRVDPEFANRLDERFHKDSVIALWKSDADWQWGRANSYSDYFTDDDVVLLYRHIEPTKANNFAGIASRFGARIDAAEILRFVELGISEEEIEKIAREEMIRKDVND